MHFASLFKCFIVFSRLWQHLSDITGTNMRPCFYFTLFYLCFVFSFKKLIGCLFFKRSKKGHWTVFTLPFSSFSTLQALFACSYTRLYSIFWSLVLYLKPNGAQHFTQGHFDMRSGEVNDLTTGPLTGK